MQGVPFHFDEKRMLAFATLKEKLNSAPIVITLDWELPFELMCNVSDFDIGAGKRRKFSMPYTIQVG